MTRAYARLAELAALEAELVVDNRLDELPALWAEREALVARLPAVPPAEAMPHLLAAQAATRGTQALLEAGMGQARAELASIAGGRRAASGYGAQARPTLVDAIG